MAMRLGPLNPGSSGSSGPFGPFGRRNFLQLGVLGLSPWMLPPVAARPAAASDGPAAKPARKAAAKNVLVVFEQGGVSQMDTWDPKPEAVAEHRSPFKTIPTVVPGMNFTELLTKTAKVADKLSVVRCMIQPTPGIGNSHPKGSQYIYSGEAPGGPVEMPDIGSILSFRLGSPCRYLPPAIMVPGNSEQAGETRTGFLPAGSAVFKTGGKDLSAPDWKVNNLELFPGVDERRFRDRSDLLSHLDVGLTAPPSARSVEARTSFLHQAQDMLTNPLTRRAFDLSTEKDAVRDRYGRGHRGQCYLLGRKLIEAGVRYVMVDVREPMTAKTPGGGNMNWDHHDAIYSEKDTNIKGGGPGAGRWGIGTWPMMGSTDQAFSALIEDMHARGLLADTLVCFVTEFGRTPKINERKGRDHWTYSFSFTFAGAGVPGGQVVGQTDKDGGYVVSDTTYTIEDYAATIYEKLGYDRSVPLRAQDGRPIFPSHHAKVIKELF
jgi:hypothetical protein